jgi:predicted transcriptional regulator
MTEKSADRSNLLSLTAEIVSAHVAKNAVRDGDVAALIQSVFDTLNVLGTEDVALEALTPAVPIKRSVTDDYIICLEDGKKLKMLKRHLMTAYGMTPEAYRVKWGLKFDYPMVAPNYTLKRQELAKKIGLGRKPRVIEPVPAPMPAPKAAARKPRVKKVAA